MYRYVIEYLGTGRKTIISHYMNAKLLLIIHIIRYWKNHIIVYDPYNYLSKHLDMLPDNILLSNNIGEKPLPRHNIVYIEPPRFPWRIFNENIVVTLTPGNYRYRIPSYYDKIYLKKISNNTYELSLRNIHERYRFVIQDHRLLFIEKPSGFLGKAYRVIEEALLEYGELSVKDTVSILVYELGIDKKKAREILSKLIENKYIRVEKGRITV